MGVGCWVDVRHALAAYAFQSMGRLAYSCTRSTEGPPVRLPLQLTSTLKKVFFPKSNPTAQTLVRAAGLCRWARATARPIAPVLLAPATSHLHSPSLCPRLGAAVVGGVCCGLRRAPSGEQGCFTWCVQCINVSMEGCMRWRTLCAATCCIPHGPFRHSWCRSVTRRLPFSAPQGALIFGHIGDTFGRNTTLRIAIIFMAVSVERDVVLGGWSPLKVHTALPPLRWKPDATCQGGSPLRALPPPPCWNRRCRPFPCCPADPHRRDWHPAHLLHRQLHRRHRRPYPAHRHAPAPGPGHGRRVWASHHLHQVGAERGRSSALLDNMELAPTPTCLPPAHPASSVP